MSDVQRREAKREVLRKFRERNPEYTQVWNRRNPEVVLYRSLKSNAVARGRTCELTLEELREVLKPMRCSVTGLELEWGAGPWAPSIDRLDNERGYSLTNVQLVCWAYNRARGTDAHSVFDKLAKAYVAFKEAKDGSQ